MSLSVGSNQFYWAAAGGGIPFTGHVLFVLPQPMFCIENILLQMAPFPRPRTPC